ncbi:MAG: 16S rRNA (guanine(527)-N(7))-methyltransferase RsmG [Calothrix sp. SM1_5_4]|nr:16S rRNA (guanine(527)-N(7))-methyltransferase RsmG [Calothrix sp. SM1_5_4]
MSEQSSVDGNALWRIPEWFPSLSPEVVLTLKSYHSELLKFNLRLNLISRNTERDADEVHFADCILASEVLAKVHLGAEVFDVGSGNGLPGILFAILRPQTTFHLVESDSRKAEFLKHMIHVLGLKNADVMAVRLESLKGMAASVAVSRGFASISKTCLGCNRIFPVGGKFYHLKGSNWSTEIAEIPSQLISIWKPELVGEYTLPVSQARRAVVCTTKKV